MSVLLTEPNAPSESVKESDHVSDIPDSTPDSVEKADIMRNFDIRNPLKPAESPRRKSNGRVGKRSSGRETSLTSAKPGGDGHPGTKDNFDKGFSLAKNVGLGLALLAGSALALKAYGPSSFHQLAVQPELKINPASSSSNSLPANSSPQARIEPFGGGLPIEIMGNLKFLRRNLIRSAKKAKHLAASLRGKTSGSVEPKLTGGVIETKKNGNWLADGVGFLMSRLPGGIAKDYTIPKATPGSEPQTLRESKEEMIFEVADPNIQMAGNTEGTSAAALADQNSLNEPQVKQTTATIRKMVPSVVSSRAISAVSNIDRIVEEFKRRTENIADPSDDSPKLSGVQEIGRVVDQKDFIDKLHTSLIADLLPLGGFVQFLDEGKSEYWKSIDSALDILQSIELFLSRRSTLVEGGNPHPWIIAEIRDIGDKAVSALDQVTQIVVGLAQDPSRFEVEVLSTLTKRLEGLKSLKSAEVPKNDDAASRDVFLRMRIKGNRERLKLFDKKQGYSGDPLEVSQSTDFIRWIEECHTDAIRPTVAEGGTIPKGFFHDYRTRKVRRCIEGEKNGFCLLITRDTGDPNSKFFIAFTENKKPNEALEFQIFGVKEATEPTIGDRFTLPSDVSKEVTGGGWFGKWIGIKRGGAVTEKLNLCSTGPLSACIAYGVQGHCCLYPDANRKMFVAFRDPNNFAEKEFVLSGSYNAEQ